MIKINQVFGKLAVIHSLGVDHWMCYCICGNEVPSSSDDLLKGIAVDCGICNKFICPENIDRGLFLYRDKEWGYNDFKREFGISPQLLRMRILDYGMTLDEALHYVPKPTKTYIYQGQVDSLKGICRTLGICQPTVSKRLKRNPDVNLALGLPPGTVTRIEGY